ncbi:MAG TPA: LysR family transcriptional regulator [Usitatibacter sp.]|jgi:DNA-binding transcriptional LysR family regulator|nr:LysR family transcriptional regulator [Usitatibacter sp.]
MKKPALAELAAVLAVARRGSFRGAATELDLSTSALSQTIAAFEASLGVRLFNRTTRSVSLSEAGVQFVESIAPAVAVIRAAMEQAGSLRDTPSGTLRINTSVGAARQVMPVFMAFLRRYPEMNLDIVTETRKIDIVRDGFDAGIRLAGSVPKDMIAVSFRKEQRFAIVASPAYFAGRTRPAKPSDLLAHTCIRTRMPNGAIEPWELSRRGGKQRIDVKGVITLDEPTLMLEAARAGLGLAYLTEWNVAADLAAGTLVRVLADWTQSLGDLCLYYPSRRHIPAGLRALIALVRERPLPQLVPATRAVRPAPNSRPRPSRTRQA